jgi:cytochrome c553
MRYTKNSNGLQMSMLGALVCMLFVSASIHAETGAASEVAQAPSVSAASEVAATPEIAPASAPVATPAVPEIAAAPTSAPVSTSAVPEVASTPVAVPAVAPAPEVAAAPPPAPGSLEERLLLCGGCHNPDGNSIIPENPRLAGLDPKYIIRQLEDFKSGKRENPTMSAIIPMVDAGEFKALGKYFSQQKRQTSESANAELVAKGKQIFEEGVIATAAPACMGCHGEDGSGSDAFPRLNGQNPAYVINQLTNFKSGGRTNDKKGLMQAVAKRLNEQEIAAVAEYMSTLKEAE